MRLNRRRPWYMLRTLVSHVMCSKLHTNAKSQQCPTLTNAHFTLKCIHMCVHCFRCALIISVIDCVPLMYESETESVCLSLIVFMCYIQSEPRKKTHTEQKISRIIKQIMHFSCCIERVGYPTRKVTYILTFSFSFFSSTFHVRAD